MPTQEVGGSLSIVGPTQEVGGSDPPRWQRTRSNYGYRRGLRPATLVIEETPPIQRARARFLPVPTHAEALGDWRRLVPGRVIGRCATARATIDWP